MTSVGERLAVGDVLAPRGVRGVAAVERCACRRCARPAAPDRRARSTPYCAMWRAFQTAASESVASTVSATRPSEARCWFSRSTTCWASDAFAAGQAARRAGGRRAERARLAQRRHRGRHDSRRDRCGNEDACPGTRRRCAVSDAPKAPLSDRSTQAIWDSARKEGLSGGLRVRARCRIAVHGERHAPESSAGPARTIAPTPARCWWRSIPTGRATSIKGAPEHPITAGLPVRQGLELPRARVLRASACCTRSCAPAPRARARFRAGRLGRGARRRRRAACARRRAPRRRVDRALQLPRHAGRPAGRRDGATG